MSKFMWCWVGVMCTAILCGVAGYTDWSRQEAKIGSLQAQVKALRAEPAAVAYARVPKGKALASAPTFAVWGPPGHTYVADRGGIEAGVTLRNGSFFGVLVRPMQGEEDGKVRCGILLTPIAREERGR